MPIRLISTPKKRWSVIGLAVAVTAATVISFAGAAFAISVSISPAAPYTDGENVTVSGSGFPTASQDPSGLQIIECADPGGTTANLPVDDTTCDATTANPLPVITDSNGNFSTSYALSALSTTDGSNIDCDATDYCVLWVGLDYVNSFSGTHAFSSPLLIHPGLAAQTVTFTSSAPSGATVGGPTYTPMATASSGLPVALTVDSTATSVCSISGGDVVSFLAPGTCTIDANQAGNTSFAPATQMQQQFTVAPGSLASQTVTFTSTAPSGATVGGNTYTPTATASSGLPVALTVDSTATSVCALSGGVVSFLASGTCTIDANQSGNGSFAPAAPVKQPFTVVAATPTTAFTTTEPSATSVVLGPSGTISDTATVKGNATNGAPGGTVNFYVCETGTSGTLTTGPCAVGSASHLSSARLAAGANDTSTAPSGAFTPSSIGTWCFSAVYSPSATYSASADNTTAGNADPGECVLVTAAGSSTVSFVSSAQVTLGPSGAVTDSVTVSGAFGVGSPSGTVVFYACRTSSSSTLTTGPCPPTQTPEDPGETLLAGAGDSSSATSGSFMPDAVGTWCLSAVYGGSSVYQGSSDNTGTSNLDPDECVLVTAAPSTTASFVSSAHVTLGTSGTVTDSVTVTGNAVGGAPAGTVDFFVCGPGGAVALCPSTSAPVGTPALAPSGSDTAHAVSNGFTPTAAGTYCFAAVYAPAPGANYTGSSDNVSGAADTNECTSVGGAPAYTFTSGTSATIGAGQTLHFVVATNGTPSAKIKKKGALPKGIKLADIGNGEATIAGATTTKHIGVYHLTLTATFGKGKTKHVATQAFTLTVT